jgi:hypothetical protein
MSVVDLRERHATAKAQVHNLRDQLRIKRASLLDTDVATYAESLGRTAVKFNVNAFRCCRTLQGHTGKVRGAPLVFELLLLMGMNNPS